MRASLLADMDALEDRLTGWAWRRKDVRAAVVVGSRARADHPADEYADLDVAIMTTAAAKYHRDRRWLSEIADVWAVVPDPSGVTYHVLFAGGLDAGIAVIPASPVKLAARVVPVLRRFPAVSRALPLGAGVRLEREIAGAAAYTRRGYRVLFDKDGLAKRFFSLFPASGLSTAPRPAEAQFARAVNEFWFVAAWTAKHIWRGEVWRARSTGLEGGMRDAVLKMVEWHAQATSTTPVDTWEGGRFIEEWASPAILSGLRRSFSGYDAAGADAALRSMMELFAALSAEAGQALGYDHMPSLARSVTDWIDQHRPAA
jgi:aminoglycoside 6-adenylyltransferase